MAGISSGLSQLPRLQKRYRNFEVDTAVHSAHQRVRRSSTVITGLIHRQGVPPRPRPKRSQQIPNPAAIGSGLPNTITNIGANLQRGVLLAGYGLFPPLGVLFFQQNTTIDDSGMDEPSPEMRYQTLFKSLRALLALLFITLVIVC
jgi:hypothetical protein